MKNKLIQEIIAKNLHCVFISPHFDDAILSCGSLISELNGKVEITIINVFTKAHGKPYTLSAKKFLLDSKYIDAEKLYEERKREDAKALSSLDVKIINLDFEDALFRRKEKVTFLGRYITEFDHLYPTYHFHIIKAISPNDSSLKRLEKQLEKFNTGKNLVFAPYAIGNHADHRIARLASEKVFDRYILYSDFPYNVHTQRFGVGFKNGEEFRLDPDIDEKTRLIKMYKTQFEGLFSKSVVPKHQEIFFSNQKL